MKKPTHKLKQWNAIHVHGLDRRRRAKEKVKISTPQKTKKKAKSNRPQSVLIECPHDFSLKSNFEGVIDVLHKIRTQSQRERNEQTYIDFRGIRRLSPTAALILAAEIDRWNKLPLKFKRKLTSVDVAKWDPKIQRLLADMGFFDLLQITKPPVIATNGNIRFMKFRSGHKADGEAIDLLRKEDLAPIIGEVPRKHYLYAAVTEAMTNVVHHAYKNTKSNWWLSASYDSTQHEVTIMIYDQGVGIPKTLPRKFLEYVQHISKNDHAEMIEMAHDLSRSKSKTAHRGHGLQRDVRGYLEKLDCHGHYRVVSLKGEYFFEKLINGKTQSKKISHNRSLNGTLIEWKLNLSNEH